MRRLKHYKGLIATVCLTLLATGAILLSSRAQDLQLGAPSTQLTYQKTLIPFTDSLYDLGTSTQAWRDAFIDRICLSGDCKSAWPAGGSGGSGNVSTSTAETAGQLAYWTSTGATPALLGKTATSALTASSPLSLSNPISVIGSSASALSLDTSGAWSGTAGSLAANGANCSAGSFPLGVNASGAVESCTDAWTEAENTSAAYISLGSLSATTPIIYNNGAFTFVGLATTSQPASSNLLVSNGGAGVYGVATSSATINSPLSGTLIVLGTGQSLSIANAAADGSTKGAASFTAADFDASSGNISIDYTNGQAASASAKGFLTSADWTTFNNKIGWGAATSTSANQFVYTNNNGLFVSAASSSLFGYTPLNPTRALTVSGTANQITSSAGAQDLSADRTWTLSLPNHVIFPANFQASNSSTTNATTTSLAVLNLTAANCDVKSTTGGVIYCGTDATAAGAADPFTWATNYGAINAATSSILWAQSGINASSTSHFVNSSTTLATVLDKLYVGPGGTPTDDSTLLFHGDKNNSWILGNDLTDNSFAIASSTTLGTNNALTIDKALKLTFGNASSTLLTASYASSTLWYGGGLLADCNSNNVLTWTAGKFGCEADDAGSGVWPFTPASYNGVAVQSTSTPLWLTAGLPSLIATSTFATYASTTQFQVGSDYITDLSTGFAITAAGVVTVNDVSCTGCVANAELANSTISGIALGSNLADLTATNGTLTFSGTYNGSTARTIGLNLSNANTWSALQTFNSGLISNAASSTIVGNFNLASTTGGIAYTTNVPAYLTKTFSYASSTQGMGTTTRSIGVAPQALTVKNVQCDFSNFMRVLLYDGTNRANDFIASSTIGTVSYTTNNSFTAGEAMRIDIGTTTNIAANVYGSCTLKFTYD